ncbi:MAG: hypothetical protein ABIP64_02075 [Burkholderiales bacterium]
MRFLALVFAVFFAFAAPAFVAADEGATLESAFAGIDFNDLQKLLQKHFSVDDIEKLKDYLRSAMIGGPVTMAADLKAKLRQFMTEMRVEYGFQFQVMMAQLKKKVFKVLPPDLAELADEFTSKYAPEAEQ